jgi:hypothetical protein
MGALVMHKKILVLFLGLLFLNLTLAEEWIFNSKNDFFNNINYPTEYMGIDPGADGLSVSSEVIVYPYLYVANSGNSTISKVDTRINKVVAVYRTGPAGTTHDPSRTTVDRDGNVWVGNRQGNKNLVKIAGDIKDCIDKNDDGVKQTSTDSTPLSWGQDECVLFSVRHWPSGGLEGVRSLTTDLDGYIWVGTYNTDKYFKIDPRNGNLIFSVNNPKPYGAVVDRDGILWSANRGQNSTSRINTVTGAHLGDIKNFVDAPPHSSPYGITVNKYNKVYFTNAPVNGGNPLPGGGFGYIEEDKLITFNQTIFDPSESGKMWFRGITADDEGHIWFSAHYVFGPHGVGNNIPAMGGQIYRIDHSTNQVICSQKSFGNYVEPIGVVMDSDYNIWAIFRRDKTGPHTKDGAAVKLNKNCQIIETVVLGLSPYTYSDATGAMTQQFTKDGWWKVTIFSSSGNVVNWSNISWTASNPGGGGFINVSLNFSDGAGAETYFSSNSYNNQDFFYDLQDYNSRYLTIYIQMRKDNNYISPFLKNLVIQSYEPVVGDPNCPGNCPVDPVVPYEYCLSYAYGTQCSAQGVQDIRRTTAWVGISDPPNSCIVGDELIESGVRCGFMVLSFFSLISLIATILIIFIIYFVVKSRSKKKKKLNKKKPGRR